MNNKLLPFLGLLLFYLFVAANTATIPSPQVITNQQSDSLWADSILQQLSVEEKIGQLINIRVSCYAEEYKKELSRVSKLIEKYHIGSVTFFQGDPTTQYRLTKAWQSDALIPLFICMDAETGLGFRYSGAIRFPDFLTMGALKNDSLIFEVGKAVGEQCKSVGLNMNFSPCVDINNNHLNPVINFRSFGSNPARVATKGSLFFKGQQEAGILSVAKHFPGHGDTDTDSHHSLPIIDFEKSRFDSVEFVPYYRLINDKIDGIMVGHLYAPALGCKNNQAASLSTNVISDLLQKELGFDGLVITDGLEMKGLDVENGIKEYKAILAGNDILLLPNDVKKAFEYLLKNVKRSKISEERLNHSVFKILKAKAQIKDITDFTTKESLIGGLVNKPSYKKLANDVYSNAITLLQNKNNILPLQTTVDETFLIIEIGISRSDNFNQTIAQFANSKTLKVYGPLSEQKRKTILATCSNYNRVIIHLQASSRYASKKYGLKTDEIALVNQIITQNNTILCLSGNPYILNNLDTKPCSAVVVGYEFNVFINRLLAEVVVGLLPANGTLPVTLHQYNEGHNIALQHSLRLGVAKPEMVGVSSNFTTQVDSLINVALAQKATPGCQVLFAKNGKIIYNKSFGYHTYKKKIKVKNTNLYDVASITKILATTLAVMRLYEEGLLDIDLPLSTYIPETYNTNKGTLIIKDVLTHQAKLQSWHPFYKEFKNSSKNTIFSPTYSAKYCIKACENLYVDTSCKDSIYSYIYSSKLLNKKEYVYSDFGFLLLQKVVENITQEPLDEYVSAQFYTPLGLSKTCFNPLAYFPKKDIVPTEEDTYWRHQTVHGYVHDMTAAMMGGVAGNAGVFSTAGDIAIVMQMLLQKGVYNGVRYFGASTVNLFTSCQFPLSENRRGLGFDRPDFQTKEDGPHCEGVSIESFGHAGFTGCYAWADKENQIIYVFLSNRVFPTMENKTLLKLNTRTNLHQLIYDNLN